MRALDEVIEIASDWTNGFDEMSIEKQMLHYLKEYHEHLKWQAYEEHCLAEEKKKIKQAYEQGYAQAYRKEKHGQDSEA